MAKYNHGNEALHGIVRPGKFTVFPQAIAFGLLPRIRLLSIKWQMQHLMRHVENGMSLNRVNCKRRNTVIYFTFWSPTVNMARDPRWGRTPETYGEDPYLASQIGVAFVKGLQGNDSKYLKVVATPKHFVANNEEHNRFSCQVTVPEQVLRNYFCRLSKHW